MSILTIYEGIKGANGTDGINGLDSSNTDDYSLDNPMLRCLNNNELSSNAFVEWGRNRTSAHNDRYNNNTYSVPLSEVNAIDYSEDFTQWFDLLNQWSIIGSTTDPFGGSDATEINLDVNTENPTFAGVVMSRNSTGYEVGGYVVVSFWVKLISGVVSAMEMTHSEVKYDLDGITSEWQQKVVKISGAGSNFVLGINPRGEIGARIGVYGVMVNNTLLSDYIKTTGSVETVINAFGDLTRQSDLGYLIEPVKTNLIHNSHDFESWTITDGTISEFQSEDAFGFKHSKISLNYASLATITLDTVTEALTPDVIYNVSFYALVTGGSLTSLTVSLGDGAEFTTQTPSVSGFERISIKVTAGTGDTITLKATSVALNAQLQMCDFQIEVDDLTSYIESSSISNTRTLDLVSMDYKYNAPKPSLPWTFIFGKNITNDSQKKTIFSNGETGANEFSLSYTGEILTLNNGGNTAAINMFIYEKVAITYDGTDARFYGEKDLITTITVGSTSFLSTKMYIGSNGVDEVVNGNLFGCSFYNVKLTDNDIIYYMGV